MGLDMYLTKETYVKQWDHQTPEERHEVHVEKGGKKHPFINTDRVSGIVEEVMYWRKANAIHGWFVENCQDGIDECQKTHITKSDLIELKELCEKVIINKTPELLPPREGFFFGSKEVDDYYYSDLADTVRVLEEELQTQEPEEYWGVSYFYMSSW